MPLPRQLPAFAEANTLYMRSAEPSVAARLPDVLRLWTPVVLDAVSVHLTKLSDRGSEEALVMVPVAWSLLQGWPDANLFLSSLSDEAAKLFRDTSRCRLLRETGTVERGVGQHKKEEHEVAGFRILLEACRSDRPAMLLVHTAIDAGQKTELLHVYAAMGLHKQHAAQQMCLARTRDFVAAACVAKAAARLLGPHIVE